MLWHKCKNGTMVNLERVAVFEIINLVDRETGKQSGNSILWAMMNGTSHHKVTDGTREECEAEMREIEAVIQVWQKPMMLPYGWKEMP